MRKFQKNDLLIIVLILLTSLFSTSCEGSRELDTLGIVLTTGIDLEDGQIVVTSEVINPATGAESTDVKSDESAKYIQGTGNTIEDAIGQTALIFDRELYYPHNFLIIFGEELVRHGLKDYIDRLSRATGQREQSFLLIAKGAKAYEIMGVGSGLAMYPGRYLFDIMRMDLHNGMSRPLTVSDFLKYFYKQSEGTTFGVASLVKVPQIDKSKSDTQLNAVCLEGGGVLQNGKLVGFFDGNEMIGFNFIVNKLKATNITFQVPREMSDEGRFGDKGENFTTVRVFKSKTKKLIKLMDGKLHLYLDVLVRAPLREDIHGVDISKPHIKEAVEKEASKKIKSMISQTMDKAQKELKVDTFGISSLVHRKYPKLWQKIRDDWKEIFTDLDYTVNVKVAIPDTGFTNAPPNIRKGK